MRTPRLRFPPLLLGLLLVLLLQACATARPPPAAASPLPVTAPAAPVSGQVWWQAAFRLADDEAGATRWALDLLLADQIVAPLLREHGARVSLWRLHRRAAADAAGHQFSLIFRTDAATAEALFAAIRASPLRARLVERGYLRELVTQCFGGPCDGAPGATSDRRWDPRLAAAWPYFIMGVSAHWLALIGEVGAQLPPAADGVDAQLARYEQIQAQVTALWQRQGEHAYLHHLNALFGYEPMQIHF